MDKFIRIVSDPTVAIPLWGALGGLITALFRCKKTILGVSISITLAALFAHWFTVPVVEYFGLPDSSLGGVGAVLGITSYEIVRILATGEFKNFIAQYKTGK